MMLTQVTGRREHVRRSRWGRLLTTRGAPLARSTRQPRACVTCGRRGFTLLELLIAMSLMVIALTISYMTFASVTRAWQRGVALSDRISHADYVMDQLVSALRSAYYPDTGVNAPQYGFWLENNGSGSRARDEMSWVKIGSAMIERQAAYAKGPHRVQVTVASDPARRSKSGVAVRAWRAYGQPEEFRPDQVERFFVSGKVQGINCRIATNMVNNRIEWESDWDATNIIPFAVEVTLYMEPLDEGAPAVKIQRAIALPVAPQSWRF
ncbi:MAG: prepilin-type N-terminal cleavage/methylation domain-containing protein [Verrucomicrobia bacterium]|nr:prepilin-type N-terminal cleavage/methylation domain-containing protein [Verrucomicrobiota bacterium]